MSEIGTTEISELPNHLSNDSGNNIILEKKEINRKSQMQQPQMQPQLQQQIQQQNMQQQQMQQPMQQQQQMQQPMQQQMQQPQPMQQQMQQPQSMQQQIQQPQEQMQQQTNNNSELINPIKGNPNISPNSVLRLPSRDMPMNTAQHSQDPNNNSDYIPENKEDYIANNVTLEEAIQKNLINNTNTEKNEKIYSEIQTPLIISIIFFIFQLPIFEKSFKKHFSYFVTNEGSMTLNGHLFKCVMVGCFYYLTNRLVNHLVENM